MAVGNDVVQPPDAAQVDAADVPVGADNGWVQVIAKGKRLMSDVLPFVPVAPLAFTNPIYVVRPREESGVSASSSPQGR